MPIVMYIFVYIYLIVVLVYKYFALIVLCDTMFTVLLLLYLSVK